MDIQSTKQLAKFFDHTILKPDAKEDQVNKICDEALEYNFFGVCVNTCYLRLVVDRLEKSAVTPLVVVGFPLGAASIESKIYETKHAVDKGAREIDTVVNLGAFFSGSEAYVRKDIREVVKAAGKVPVKVILETAYLNDEQIYQLSRWSAEEGALFVKTSTGFASRGASVDDIKTMKRALVDGGFSKVGIKASGGIKTLAFLEELVAAGATRIGASASVGIVEEFEKR